MSDVLDIGGTFRGVFCQVHLPDDDGSPTLGGEADGEVFLAVRAFADAHLDDGPTVHFALTQKDETAIMPLSLQKARALLECLTEALAAAEALK